MTTAKDALASIVTEELGTLSQVPKEWIKYLTNRGAGDKSELKLLKSGVKGIREVAAIAKGARAIHDYAGILLKKSDGSPVGIIHFHGEGAKPWQFILPSGERHKDFDYRRQRNYNRNRYAHDAYSTVKVERTDMSLNDISGKIPFAEGIDVYALTTDKNREKLGIARKAANQGVDSDINKIKLGAAGKFVDQKASGSVEQLKAASAKLADDIKAKIAQATEKAATGNFARGEILAKTDLDQLETLLYDLHQLNSRVAEIKKVGVRSRYGNEKGWDYEYFEGILAKIQAKLNNLTNSNKYESLAKEFLDKLLECDCDSEGKTNIADLSAGDRVEWQEDGGDAESGPDNQLSGIEGTVKGVKDGQVYVERDDTGDLIWLGSNVQLRKLPSNSLDTMN